LSTARAANTNDGRSLAAKLATADALRLAGSTEEARERLEDARAMSFSRTAEFYRIDARLSATEAGGRLESGLRSARQAVELDPDAARYALLLARTERASEHPDQAREALEGILLAHPGHPVATALIAEMDAEVQEEAVADAAAASDAAAAAEAELETPLETASATEAEPEEAAAKPSAPVKAAPAKQAAEQEQEQEPEVKAVPAPKPKRPKPPAKEPRMDEYDRLAQAARSDAFVDGRPPVLDYESNMKKGYEELEAGQYARARAYFDSALEVHPGSADAMDALGDVGIAVNDYASALRYYRVAAQRGHPDGYFKLGNTYERLGRNEEAVSAYYTYMKRRPTGTHAEAARTAIQNLEPRAKLPPEPESEDPAAEEPATESDPATP
jgi:tetratricopeptide (TPR) repeat protein